MGWNTYYGLARNYNESTIVSIANAMVARGLRDAGYRYVWLDGGWWQGARDTQGNIVTDPSQWPHGLKWLMDYLHRRGLLGGVYTDAGTGGFEGPTVGSYGHYQQDADQFAAWGFDAVKVDFGGGNAMGLDPAAAYTQFAAAVKHNSSSRPILFNICNPFPPNFNGLNDPPFTQSAWNSYSFGRHIANSWRTAADVGLPHDVQFAGVLGNLQSDAIHPKAAGPGHWNDPDYVVPEYGLSPAGARTQFGMWAELAAPLIIGSDVRTLSDRSVRMLENRKTIAIDQDRRGIQGRRVQYRGRGQVWSKPLVGGARAVALLNPTGTQVRIGTSARAVGLDKAPSYRVLDVWSGKMQRKSGRIVATVPPQGTVLFRVTPSR